MNFLSYFDSNLAMLNIADPTIDLYNFDAKALPQENCNTDYVNSAKINFVPYQDLIDDRKTNNTTAASQPSLLQGPIGDESMISGQNNDFEFYLPQIENVFTRNDSYDQGRLHDTPCLQSAFEYGAYEEKRAPECEVVAETYFEEVTMIPIHVPKEKKLKNKKRLNNKEINAMQANVSTGNETLSITKEMRAKNKKVCKSENKSGTESTRGSPFTQSFVSSPLMSSTCVIENEFQFDLNNGEQMWGDEIEFEGVRYRVPAMDAKVECFVENILNFETQEKKDSKKTSTLPQNKKRNLPGIIVMRVAASMTKILKGQNSQELNYIQAVLNKENFVNSAQSSSEFLEFLKNFDGKGKTYEWVKSKVSLNLYYGRIFRSCVDAFLAEEGKQDFNAWIKASSRMREDSRNALMNEKAEFRVNFEQRLIDL